MLAITTWIKRLSRARDIQTAKSLVNSAIEDLSRADFVSVLTEGDELTEHSFGTIHTLSEKYTDDEYFWLTPIEATQLDELMPDKSQNIPVLVIPVKDEKIVAAILVGWIIPPQERDKYLAPVLILAECFLIVLQNVVVHTLLSKQMAERTSNLSEARQEAETANQLKSLS